MKTVTVKLSYETLADIKLVQDAYKKQFGVNITVSDVIRMGLYKVSEEIKQKSAID